MTRRQGIENLIGLLWVTGLFIILCMSYLFAHDLRILNEKLDAIPHKVCWNETTWKSINLTRIDDGSGEYLQEDGYSGWITFKDFFNKYDGQGITVERCEVR